MKKNKINNEKTKKRRKKRKKKMVKNIYTDFETDQTIKTILRLEPEFNVSEFFKNQILEHAGILATQNSDINFLENRLMDLKNIKSDNDEKIKYLQDRINESKHIIEVKEKQEIETFENENKKTEFKIKNIAETIKENFPDVKEDSKKRKELAKQFLESRYDSLPDFLESKGYENKKLVDEILKIEEKGV